MVYPYLCKLPYGSQDIVNHAWIGIWIRIFQFHNQCLVGDSGTNQNVFKEYSKLPFLLFTPEIDPTMHLVRISTVKETWCHKRYANLELNWAKLSLIRVTVGNIYTNLFSSCYDEAKELQLLRVM